MASGELAFRQALANALLTPEGGLGPALAARGGLRDPKNLFDPNDTDCALAKYVVAANGTLLDNVTYNTTGFIQVVPGVTYTRSHAPLNLTLAASIPNGPVAYFDENRAYVSGDSGSNKYQFVIPDGVAFMRMSLVASMWWSAQIEESPVNTTWVSFRGFEPPREESHFQLWALRQTHYRASKLLLPTPEATQLIVNLIGDSYFHAPSRAVGPFTDYLAARFGDAGGGWCGFGWQGGATGPYVKGANQPVGLNGNARPALYPVSIIGNPTTTYYTAATADLAYATLAAAGDALEVDYPVLPVISTVKLHFVGTGAGSIRYTFNGGSSWTALNVSGTNGTTAVSTLSLTGYSGAGTLRIEWVSGTARISGVDLQSTASGIRVNKLAATGGSLAQWAGASIDQWQTSFSALGGHLTIIEDGRNSQAGSVSATTRDGQLRSVINRARGQTGSAFGLMAMDVLVYSPPENQAAGRTVGVSSYAQLDRRRAYLNRCAHIDGQKHFGVAGLSTEYGSAGDLALFNADLIHPDNLTGGRLIMADLIKAVMPW